MSKADGGPNVDMAGVVCPFHAAGVNPSNAERAGSPPASKPGERNSLTLLHKHAQFHAGVDKKLSRMVMLVGILGGKKWSGVLRNLVTWSYDPAELALSPLNKDPINSGMVSRAVPGSLDYEQLDHMLDEFGSEYVPVGGEDPERGIGTSELQAFLDAVASEADAPAWKQKVGRKMANFELPMALRFWPSEDHSGNSYLSEATLRTFYGAHLFPGHGEGLV